MNIQKAVLYTDGGSRGNPGESAIGVVLMNVDGKIIETESQRIGIATNNIAEYQALTHGLVLAKSKNVRNITCFLDSELVVKQLNRKYRLRDKHLQTWFVKIWNLMSSFDSIQFKSIPRSRNFLADHLVNQALEKGGRAPFSHL